MKIDNAIIPLTPFLALLDLALLDLDSSSYFVSNRRARTGDQEPSADDLGQRVGEITVGVDAAEFASLDQRRDGRPVFSAVVRRDLMMPGVWGGTWWSFTHVTQEV